MIGSKREQTGSSKLFVGYAEAKVSLISPTRKQLADWYGRELTEDEEEINYLKEKDGIDSVRLDIYRQEVKTSYKYKRTLFLENRDVKTEWKEGKGEESEFIPKYQYLNCTGESYYCESKEDLPEWFTTFYKYGKDKAGNKTKEKIGDKVVRIAKVGEAALMEFVRAWLNYNLSSVDTNILLDTKQLFKGNFKELNSEINGEHDETIIDILEVNRVEKDGETKEYQDVYKTSLKGFLIRTLRNTDFSLDNIQKWSEEKKHKTSNPNGRYLKDYEQLAVDITDEQYGSKNYFLLEPFQEYDSSKNPASFAGAPITIDGVDY